MAKIIPITEHFQHFLGEMKESFWGDLYGQTRQAWQQFFELQSERQRDRFSGWGRYERRRGKRRVYRNGYYERDFVTRFGTIRLRIARTRDKSFLPVGLRRFQRRAEEVSLLIREAFLRGISTRQVGRVVAAVTGETVSGQTGAATEWTQAGADAGRLWHTPGRESPSAGFLAQPGRGPGRLGGTAAGSLPAWTGGPIAGPDSHRWLCRPGGGDPHRLSAGAAS